MDKKAIRRQLKAEALTDLRARLPMSPDQLQGLLEHLDAELTNCDHGLRLTHEFLASQRLLPDAVIPWLNEHGGYCDCEVLANLEDVAEALKEPKPIPPPRPKQQRPPRDLSTKTGWDFTQLPQPWRVANMYVPAEPLRLEIGKKGGCTITVVESPLPPGDQLRDDYWSRLWLDRADLPPRGELRVSRDSLRLPEALRSVVVSFSGWTPVFGWILPTAGDWHLEINTESNRAAGDLPQVAALLARLAKAVD